MMLFRSDEELVQAFQAGDPSVFDTLVSRWDRKIQGLVFRVVGRQEDARDVCQEVFLKAYRGLPGFKKEARFSSWLYQIALNACRDRLRRRKARPSVSIEDLDETADGPLGQRGPSALERVEALELAQRVASAVRALSDDQRTVIVLKEYQGLTFPEIAETLGVPVSTVKTRLYRGLGHLRLLLEADGLRGDVVLPATPSAWRRDA